MLLETVIKTEAERNKRMILSYQTLLPELPKGSRICRKKKNYYLKYRANGKLHDEYIGKEGKTVSAIRTKLSLRKHYSEMLSKLLQEQKAIQKILGGLI